ncbi:MAG TPA: hypothetical protein PKX17_06925, partial [Candidatus Methanomethylicus sp.]|nr:hypothetical protein [Candidatus Methanomethylicus sp.]
GEDNQQVAARKVNIACKFNLGPECTNINLQLLAQMFPDLGGKCVIERMAAVFFLVSSSMPCLRQKSMQLGIRRLKDLGRNQTQAIYRRFLILIYEPGNGVITGGADEALTRYMAHQFCHMLAVKTGMPARLTNLVLTNIVLNMQMQNNVHLDLLKSRSNLGPRIKYNPAKFPMAVIHSASRFDSTLDQRNSNIAALISHVKTGGCCVNITGILTTEQGFDFMREIYPEIWRFQTDPSTGALLHMDAPTLQLAGGPSLSSVGRSQSLSFGVASAMLMRQLPGPGGFPGPSSSSSSSSSSTDIPPPDSSGGGGGALTMPAPAGSEGLTFIGVPEWASDISSLSLFMDMIVEGTYMDLMGV